MKKHFFVYLSIITMLIVSATVASSQLKLPRPSQKASVMQTIGVTDITITYYRPGVKGRKIFGEAPTDSYAKGEATLDNSGRRPEGMAIVPYGHLWRTGANDATQFVVTDPVSINGQPLPAGEYSLHTIPNKDEWIVVFNSTANQWGSFSYDASKDTLRVKAKPEWATQSQEWLAFDIEPTADNAAKVTIAWEKVRVPFTVSVDIAATTIAQAKVAVAAAKSDDWQTPFNAAGFANTNGAKADAAKWIEQSLKAIDEAIAAKPNYANTSRKATILFAAGRTQDAIAAGEKAIAIGKAEKANTEALEKRVADAKAGK
ncbi:MAG: DUF2911 domain-containing protein [Pyrinomonadaceae bacterium]